MTSARIHLLVSVRDANEAMRAIEGGADIVDIKEPLHGSLGRASADRLESIAHRLLDADGLSKGRTDADASLRPKFALSVALGEATEWLNCGDGLQREYAAALHSLRPQFLKIGLSDLVSTDARAEHWADMWSRARQGFSVNQGWVAVAYADHSRARSPEPAEVLEAAAKSRCSVLLVDTFEKDGTTLLDWLSHEQLRSLRTSTCQYGMRLALAGRVTENELPGLIPINPDIVAVRGAVCMRGDRTLSVDVNRIKAFAAAMNK